MKKSGYSVAVIGASTLAGRQLREALRDRQFPVREWRLYDRVERLGDDEGEDGAAIKLIDQADLDDVDLVFACDPAGSAITRPSESILIDLTDVSGERSDVPMIVPEVNAADAADYVSYGVLANPVPGAIALSVVLKPIEDAARLRRVVAAGYEPTSSAGNEGIEELAQQCRELLGGYSADNEASSVFPRRIAFNLIPQVGDFVGADKPRGEWQVESQTRRVLDLPDLPITVTGVRVPTFYGHGYALNVETEDVLDAAAARDLLRGAPGILLLDDEGARSYPTPVDAMETDAIYVGRVRDDPTVPCGLNLWVTVDGTRKGGAINAVQTAELLIRDYL
jgi:aspartate-semialdehyde dehydrogenase